MGKLITVRYVPEGEPIKLHAPPQNCIPVYSDQTIFVKHGDTCYVLGWWLELEKVASLAPTELAELLSTT